MPGALLNPPTPSPYQPSSWLPNFRPHTSRTRIVTLPPQLVTSILSGTVYSPPSPTTTTTQLEWSDGTIDTLPPTSPPSDTFGIQASLNQAISTLGGSVCPKFDTFCPIDATWANLHRSTKCTTAEEVLTLLKSSERVMNGVHGENGLEIALRQWADLDDRMEFRVFIKEGIVVGVCQRMAEVMVQYSEQEMDQVVEKVSTFYETRVRGRFPVDAVVMDVYIDGRGVWIVDFAQWEECDALLFEWEELRRAEWMSGEGRAQFRCAVRHGGIRVSRRVFDGLPVELRGLSGGESLVEAARRLMEEQGE